MHTFLTVTATGTKFAITVAGANHGAAFKRATSLAEGCAVKHEAPPANEHPMGLTTLGYAFKLAGLH